MPGEDKQKLKENKKKNYCNTKTKLYNVKDE